MSNDAQFTATGPAAAGFQTAGSTLNVGAEITGAFAGGDFHASATAPGALIAGVKGNSPYGSGFLGGDANDDSTNPDRPRGVYGESLGPGGIGAEGIGAAAGVTGQLLDNPFTIGILGGHDPVFHELAGAYGQSPKQGVTGMTTTDFQFSTGVYGFSQNGGGVGVRGETVTGIAVQARSFGAGLAGHFSGAVTIDGIFNVLQHCHIGGDINANGNVNVIGDVTLANRDLAERFPTDTPDEVLAGMVMVMNGSGGAAPCESAYDKRVLGVVSGAGSLRPAITLGADGSDEPAATIALAGTVYCLVDAGFEAIETGDLLTSSPTRGHAMKASEAARSRGTIIGKAAAGCAAGRGLIPLVVTLQ